MTITHKQNPIKTIAYLLFTIICSFSLYENFLSKPTATCADIAVLNEAYDSKLSYIQSIEDLDCEVKIRLKNDFSDTSKVVNAIDDILRNRFYHGYSEYSMQDNWLAYICSKVIFWGIKHPVIPDDILKYPMAACSQQGLVFQAMLRKYDISYATIAFGRSNNQHSGHYAVSAFYNNSWHYFDTNQEPIKLTNNPSIETIIKEGKLGSIYSGNNSISSQWLNEKIQNGLIHRVNKNILSGIKMMTLHYVTGFLSSWLWFILLGAYCSRIFIKYRDKQHTVVKPYTSTKRVEILA
jgi:hypothetical protein